MADIPRKPTFPDHIVNRIIKKIQQQVEDDVIPVSTGIYTEEKLVYQLQTMPRPNIPDYDDHVFYNITENAGICPINNCPVCQSEFNSKRKPVMCHFCTKWNCEECISPRKRLNPLQNNPNGARYSICGDCDQKFLLLFLNHAYVENRVLLQTAILKVSKQLQQIEEMVEKTAKKNNAMQQQPKRKFGIKQSLLKKQELQAKKNIKRIDQQIFHQRQNYEKLLNKLQNAKIKASQFEKKKMNAVVEKVDSGNLGNDDASKNNKQSMEVENHDISSEQENHDISSEQENHQSVENQQPSEIEKRPEQIHEFKSGRMQYARQQSSRTQQLDEESNREKSDTQLKSSQTIYIQGSLSVNFVKENSYDYSQDFRDLKQNTVETTKECIQDIFSGPVEESLSQFSEYFQDSNPQNPPPEQQAVSFPQSKKSLEEKEEEEELQDENSILLARQQLLREAIMKKKEWDEHSETVIRVDEQGKCKCSVF